MINLLVILVITLSLSSALTIEKDSPNQACPPNHMELVSLETLGVQNDLNLTLAALKDKIKLNTIAPHLAEKAYYSIY